AGWATPAARSARPSRKSPRATGPPPSPSTPSGFASLRRFIRPAAPLRRSRHGGTNGGGATSEKMGSVRAARGGQCRDQFEPFLAWCRARATRPPTAALAHIPPRVCFLHRLFAIGPFEHVFVRLLDLFTLFLFLLLGLVRLLLAGIFLGKCGHRQRCDDRSYHKGSHFRSPPLQGTFSLGRPQG